MSGVILRQGGVQLAVISTADRAANFAGLDFYIKLSKNVLRKDIFKFDICDYVKKSWEEWE